MKLIIKQGGELVAQAESYTGPIPRPGEYIFHPHLDDDGTGDPSAPGGGVMSVKTVTYGILTRPRGGEDHFVARPEPVVEVQV